MEAVTELRLKEVFDAARHAYALTTKIEFTNDQIKSHVRKADVALARHLTIYTALKCIPQNKCSLPQLGRTLGGRDHTTILHAYDRVLGLLTVQDKVTVRFLVAVSTELPLHPVQKQHLFSTDRKRIGQWGELNR